jgi:hypothetical protein
MSTGATFTADVGQGVHMGLRGIVLALFGEQ